MTGRPGRARVEDALAAAAWNGPPCKLDTLLDSMDSDEAAAWVEALSDLNRSERHLARALAHCGYPVHTPAAVKTWRRRHGIIPTGG